MHPRRDNIPAGPPAPASPAERLRRALYDILFPSRCVGCGSIGPPICDACQASIELAPAGVCVRCGATLPRPSAGCPICRRRASPLAGCHSVAYSSGVLRVAIHRFKYDGQKQLAAPLGRLLADWWARLPLPADVLAPVPLHALRERERGYNQALLLCRELSPSAGVPCEEGALLRSRHTRPQVGLSAAERRHNVAGAFTCADGRLAGRRVVLLDDIMTTGATLEAAAAAAMQAGAASVVALTLARARVQHGTDRRSIDF